MRGYGTGKVRNYFPAYRVFIYGVEVTRLCSSVRTNWPTNSPAQCTIELINPDQLMTISLDDMRTLSALRMNTNRISQALQEAIKLDQKGYADVEQSKKPYLQDNGIYDATMERKPAEQAYAIMTGYINQRSQNFLDVSAMIDANTNLAFTPAAAISPVSAQLANIKNDVLLRKIEKGKFITSSQGVDGQKLPPELFYKYPLYQGKWIWHFSDPVTVAFRDPTDPAIWYWAHRGTVTDVAEKENEDAQSILTITSEGVLKVLRSARMFQATGAILTPDIEEFVNGAYETLLKSTPCSNFLQGMTLRNIVELMLFGSQSIVEDLNARVAAGITSAEMVERFGVLVTSAAKMKERLTDKDIEHFRAGLRNIGTKSLGFKWHRGNQGSDVRILGGDLDATDRVTGVATSLYEWQRLIDNRIRVEDVGTMLVQPMSEAQGADAAARQSSVALGNGIRAEIGKNAVDSGMSIEDAITTIGTDFEQYPIAQNVRLLVPSLLGSRLGKNVVEGDMTTSIASQAEFFDRLSLLQKTIDGMEFVMYDTPRGDIIIEMPLYDFEPYMFARDNYDSTDYNEDPGLIEVLKHAGQDILSAFTDEATRARAKANAVGDNPNGVSSKTPWPNTSENQNYESDFAILAFEQVGIDIASSEQDVKTAFMVTPRITEAQSNDQSKTASRRVTAILPNLLPMYGLRVEQGGMLCGVKSPEAARVYAHIMLNKTNADTVNLRVTCLSNWAAWPNRPIWIERRNIVATTKSIAHSIAWQSDISTEYGLWHSKFWDGQITIDKKGVLRLLFTPFGGVNARPFNYSYILGIRDAATDVGSPLVSPLADAILSDHKGG